MVGAMLAATPPAPASAPCPRTAPRPARPPGGAAACPSDRLVALGLDALVAVVALVVPLTALTDARHGGLAAVTGFAVAVAYLGVPIAACGRTLGQRVVGLRVVDARSGPGSASAGPWHRSAIVVAELAAAASLVLAVAVAAELVATAADSPSLTDRLLRTRVIEAPTVDAPSSGNDAAVSERMTRDSR